MNGLLIYCCTDYMEEYNKNHKCRPDYVQNFLYHSGKYSHTLLATIFPKLSFDLRTFLPLIAYSKYT